MSAIGELESEILAILKEKGSATASDVLDVLKDRREVAYTTVSTTLDRLHKKSLVGRKALRGPGGTKYLFSPSADERRKTKIIESTLNRLTSAFGESAYSAIYKHLQNLPPSDFERLRRQVERARKTKVP
jgi:predicted transcriptional regulator